MEVGMAVKQLRSEGKTGTHILFFLIWFHLLLFNSCCVSNVFLMIAAAASQCAQELAQLAVRKVAGGAHRDNISVAVLYL